MAAGQGKRIPDETRAAVMAALLEGQGVMKVAEQYKIPHGTVSRLKKEIPTEQLNEVERKKGDRIAEMISANLDASFEAMKNLLAVTQDAKWLRRQRASEIATLLGVTSDKVFRVLEAIENAQEEPNEWPDEVSSVR